MERAREFEFSDRDFNRLRSLVSEHTGISLSDGKRELVYGRLSRRLRELELGSFGAYYTRLNAGDAEELEQFTNAITTNLTSFFREAHHFEYLAGTLLPALLERNGATRRLRVWSAGCSTGEEPYSIAMVLRESIPNIETWDVRVLATDLDSDVLERARSGVYKAERVEGLPKVRLKRWFRKGTGDKAKLVKVSRELQRLITFKQLNLMQAWPLRHPFDLIFCRNVIIYFTKETQKGLIDRFADLLPDDGHLFVGHSESLFKVTTRFDLIGKTVYRKMAR